MEKIQLINSKSVLKRRPKTGLPEPTQERTTSVPPRMRNQGRLSIVPGQLSITQKKRKLRQLKQKVHGLNVEFKSFTSRDIITFIRDTAQKAMKNKPMTKSAFLLPNLHKKRRDSIEENKLQNKSLANLQISRLVKNQVVKLEENKGKPKAKILQSDYSSSTGSINGTLKPHNQDSWTIIRNFMGSPAWNLYLVADGHGPFGHKVSGLIKQKLPTFIQNTFPKKGDEGITHSFDVTNYHLWDTPGIDIKFSGSTCCTALVDGTKITLANVGDSKAVLGRIVNKKWEAVELTKPQDPSQPEEHARITAAGGIVSQQMDSQGQLCGPHRVWIADRSNPVPGLAMSRAFGNSVASSVGVIAKPVITHHTIDSRDRFLVLASDGIWEFLSNKTVIQMIAQQSKKTTIRNV